LENGDELICWKSKKRIVPADFNHKRNVLFVHGFTAHGSYLEEIIEDFDRNGFNVFVFNYNSYKGIERAANSLMFFLQTINKLSKSEIIYNNKISFVCHSMGGLVIRAFTYLPQAIALTRNIITLGTPHAGTLRDAKMVRVFVEWGEYVTTAMPGATSLSATSAQELTARDKDPILLARLLKENLDSRHISVLSISGGRPVLRVAKNPIANASWHRYLQRHLGQHSNDGLVAEPSSSLLDPCFARCLEVRDHFNSYPEFSQINHSALVESHNLSLYMMNWLMSDPAP
jgi:esterase/lipase